MTALFVLINKLINCYLQHGPFALFICLSIELNWTYQDNRWKPVLGICPESNETDYVRNIINFITNQLYFLQNCSRRNLKMM